MRRRVCAIDHLRKRAGSVAGVKPQLIVRDGQMKAVVSEDQMTHDAQVILRTFEQGIRDVASSYPKYIHITLR